MVAIHPSLTLVLDLDESLVTQDTKLEIGRCYSHIGTPIVRSHETNADARISNIAHFMVSMGTKKYLMSEDEGADELWNNSVEPWIGSMLYKVGNNMAAFNKRMRKIGLPELDFDRFDIELEAGRFTVSLVPDPENRIGRAVAAQVGLARTLLNNQTLRDATRIQAPSISSWQTQEADARSAWDAEHAADATKAPNEEKTRQEAEPRGPMKHWVGPMPDRDKDPEGYAAWEKADRAAKSYENTAVPPTDSDELPPIGNPVEPTEAPRFDFDVDYSVWDVYFADGSCRTYDTTQQTFLG